MSATKEPALSIRDQVSRAGAALADGHLEEAEALFRAVLDQAPNHREAWLGLGQCARLHDDREAAFAAHDALVRVTDGQDPWALLQAAFDAHVLGHLDGAEQRYRAVLDLLPGQREALLGLGQCARLRDDRDAAAAAHHDAVQAFPNGPDVRLQLAFDLHALGRLAEAEVAYRAVLAVDPARAQALLGIGYCARSRGAQAEALAAHEAAYRATGDEAARLQVAIDLQALGRSSEAADVYGAVLAVDPANLVALLGLARLRREDGHAEAALALFRRAVAQSNGETALIECVLIECELNGADAARRTAELALASAPSVEAALALGVVERWADRHEQALAAFGEAHRLDPRRLDPVLEMAAASRSLGRQADCDRLLAEAVRIDPGNLHTLNQLAFQAMMGGDPLRALKHYEDAAGRYPAVLELQLAVAEALAVSGRPRDAFARLDQLPDEQRERSATALKRIDLLHRCGLWPEALDAARQLTSRAPDDIRCWIARATIELFLGSEAELAECIGRMGGAAGRERVRCLLLAGLAAERAGAEGRAAKLLREALAIAPNDAECLTQLIRFALLKFDLETARFYLGHLSASQAPALRLQRRSANPSQTLFGQVLDEYALDETMTAIRPALAAAPADRLPRLLDLVSDHPDSPAAAIATLRELARLGLVAAARPPPTARNERIPRRITQFWDKEIPADVADIMRSWPERNPDHEVRVFDRAAALAYLRRHHPPAVARAFERAREAAQAADLFRLAWLAREGGLYVDADDRCLRLIDDLLPTEADLVLYQEDLASIGNDLIAAVPGHDVIRRALALATEALDRGDADVVWLSTGPGLLTRAFARSFAEASDRSAFLDRVVVLNRLDLFPAVATHCLAAYKVVGDHWSRTAFGGGTTKPRARQTGRWAVTVDYGPMLWTSRRPT